MTASRARFRALLERHGCDAVTAVALEAGFDYAFEGEDASLAYVDTGDAWVAAGGPVARREDVGGAMRGFCERARRAGRRACFFGVEGDRARGGGFERLHVGEQPIWDPRSWHTSGRQRRTLRQQLHRAARKGVTVRDLAAEELNHGDAREAIGGLASRWLDTRAMAPLGFVVRLAPFERLGERLFLVAEQAGRVVGCLIAVPLHGADGWLVQHVLRDPRAPNGTVETLFDALLRKLAPTGCARVVYGLAPLLGVRSRVLRCIRELARPLYDFDGLARFKRKLKPDAWQSVHLVFPENERAAVAVIDALKAFAGGSLLGFGWRTLLHQRSRVLLVLAWLLVPWTALLALADTARWFPAAWVQGAWIAFDVLLFAGLVTLSRRFTPMLALSLAVAAALDLILGAAQLAWWNADRLSGALEHAVAVVALVAPTFAAAWLAALWINARRARVAPGSRSAPRCGPHGR